MRRILRSTLAIAVVLMLGLSLCAQDYSGDYAVITNTKNTVESVSRAELRRLVLGQDRFWGNRIPVSLVMRDSQSPEQAFVLGKLLKMAEHDYREHWSNLVFRGGAGSEPVEVPSNGLASGLVASRLGGLCVLRADQVPKNGSVKIVRVDGKLPGDDNYPLR